MISERRKYRLGMVLANQHLSQLTGPVRDAILGNVGTVVTFRLGPDDARLMAREFHPRFNDNDFMNLPNHHILLRLMIDGAPSEPFSAITLPRLAG